MNTLQSALTKIMPNPEPVKPTKEQAIELALATAARSQDRDVVCADGVIRIVAAIELEETEQDAIAWIRKGGLTRMAIVVLAIRLKDASLVFEIIVNPSSEVRVIHLVGRLRKHEARARNFYISKRDLYLLSLKGQPDLAGLRHWDWDPEGLVPIRSIGTTRLTYDDVFSIIAAAMTEDYAVENTLPKPGRRRLEDTRHRASC